MFIDLHTHTTCSDGTLTPEALVQYAKEKKLRAVAVTDHDTVSGNGRALKEGETIRMEIVLALSSLQNVTRELCTYWDFS